MAMLISASTSFNRTSFQQQLKLSIKWEASIECTSFNRTSFQQQLKLTASITHLNQHLPQLRIQVATVISSTNRHGLGLTETVGMPTTPKR